MHTIKRKLALLSLIFVFICTGCSPFDSNDAAEIFEMLVSDEFEYTFPDPSISIYDGALTELSSTEKEAILTAIPDYSGNPYVEVNNNIPFFSETDLTTQSFEFYSELDDFGRCGTVYACINQELMPTEERESIGMIKPTGWHTVKYDCIADRYLYNRCHLIGYQLTGENANVQNLITGTRYLNIEGMLPFENMVADYIEETGNHVLYRVTPIFDGNNLVANGVLMEAISVEDKGAGICFNIYCYNVQPGVMIDYTTGDSWES